MKKILVAVDGSPREAGVVGAARVLAERTGAKLWFLRVVSLPRELPPEAFFVAPENVVPLLERHGEEGIAAAMRDVPPTLVGGTRVLVATPWQGICRVATELDVDLVVVGSHGYDALDRVLGTTAAKVVNHADRAVLVVRAAERLAS